MRKGWIWIFFILRLQMLSSVCAITRTRGSSLVATTSSSRRSTWLEVMFGTIPATPCSNKFPTFWLNWQVIKACSKLSTTSSWHSWQCPRGLLDFFILSSLSCVGSILCRSFQRKVFISGVRPGNLASLHEPSQSLVGASSSALHGFYSSWLFSSVFIIKSLSLISRLYHSALVRVAISRGTFSWKYLIVSKKSLL